MIDATELATRASAYATETIREAYGEGPHETPGPMREHLALTLGYMRGFRECEAKQPTEPTITKASEAMSGKTTSELTDAAMRWAKRHEGVYDHIENAWQSVVDSDILATAWLAEHPEDDEEPITVEWIIVIWPEYRDGIEAWIIQEPKVKLVYCGGGDWSIYLMTTNCDGLNDAEHIRDVSSRGDVRAFCRGMGQPIKEGGE